MVETLAYMVVAAGLSLLAQQLLKGKNKALAQDDKPTTTATRGSYIPLLNGRRRVGAIVAWAGDRRTRKEAAGKKGSAISPEVRVFTEGGWHILAHGPGKALHLIEQSGKAIFVGPITPDSHPSGSEIDLGKEGSFVIYWGERSQPVNTWLGSADRTPEIGIDSRWPGKFYIVWTRKRLGAQPVWPLLTYEIEVAPSVENHLTDSSAYYPPTQVLDGPSYQVWDVDNGVEGVGRIVLFGDRSADFAPSSVVRLTGNGGLPNQDFTLLNVEVEVVSFLTFTFLYPVGGLTGATVSGDMQAYTPSDDDGYNPAHILADLWFSPWPRGIGASTSEFDMAAFEAIGQLFETEELRCSVLVTDGTDLRSVLGSIHQDLGLLLPIDPVTGKLKYVAVREPSGTLPELSADLLSGLTDIETNHGERKTDKVLFSFSDRANFYRDMTIGINDFGQAAFEQYHRAKTVQITTTTHFATANTIGERRSQEELAGGAALKLSANREARTLMPGTYILAHDVAEVLMVTKVETDPLSGLVSVEAIPDFMGATRSTFEQSPALLPEPAQTVEPDPQFQPVELPEWISGPQQQIIVARLRAHDQVEGSAIHISRDDATFVSKGSDESIMQGGTLATAITADELWELDENNGPIINALGPDIASVTDLSSDEVSWRRGRQLVVIGSEIFFLQTIVDEGSGQYRLAGLLRARYDTRPQAHAIGAEVYIIQDDDGLPIEDVLLEPEVSIYAKSQAFGRGVANLAAIVSEELPLYGKGIRPVPVSDIRFDTLEDDALPSATTWLGSAGGDLPLTWAYYTPRSPGTGAGFAGAGIPQSPADPEGSFVVEILNASNTVMRTVTVTGNSYVYGEAARLADFSAAEPASFKARITQLRSGLLADPVTQTFTRV